jgi:hypothetical protein
MHNVNGLRVCSTLPLRLPSSSAVLDLQDLEVFKEEERS